MKSGIYCIKNKKNFKMYIGQSKDLDERRRSHVYHLKHKTHFNKHLQNSFNKYGIDNFFFDVLIYLPISYLDEAEKFFINLFKTNDLRYGYNKDTGGTTNKIISKESRRIMSINKVQQWKNQQSVYNSDEYRNKKSLLMQQQWQNATYRKSHIKQNHPRWNRHYTIRLKGKEHDYQRYGIYKHNKHIISSKYLDFLQILCHYLNQNNLNEKEAIKKCKEIGRSPTIQQSKENGYVLYYKKYICSTKNLILLQKIRKQMIYDIINNIEINQEYTNNIKTIILNNSKL